MTAEREDEIRSAFEQQHAHELRAEKAKWEQEKSFLVELCEKNQGYASVEKIRWQKEREVSDSSLKHLEQQYKEKLRHLEEENQSLKNLVDDKLEKGKYAGSHASAVRAELIDELQRVETAHRRTEAALREENEALQAKLKAALNQLKSHRMGSKTDKLEFEESLKDIVSQNKETEQDLLRQVKSLQKVNHDLQSELNDTKKGPQTEEEISIEAYSSKPNSKLLEDFKLKFEKEREKLLDEIERREIFSEEKMQLRDDELDSVRSQLETVKRSTDLKIRSLTQECKLLERQLKEKDKGVKMRESKMKDEYAELRGENEKVLEMGI